MADEPRRRLRPFSHCGVSTAWLQPFLELGVSTTHLVSIIIPCYRQGRYLCAAVDCALRQTHPKVEVVVVNDGSDDNTHEVCQRYGDRIVYVRQANAGLPAARNAGLDVARGKLALFLDADDLLHPDAVAAAVQVLNHEPQGIAVLGYRKFSDSQLPEQGVEVLLSDVPIMPQILHENVAPPHSHLIPCKLLKELGGFSEDRTIHGCEDWDLWLRSALRGVRFIPVPLAGAYYRRYEGSMSTNELRMLSGRVSVLLKAHREIVDDTSLRRRWAVDLAVAEREFHRHCVARGVARPARQRLWVAVQELNSLGFGPPRSRARRILDVAFGDTGERIALTYLKWRDPDSYAYYNRCNA